MNQILQFSQVDTLKDSGATWLHKRVYASSQALVDDLLAHAASLNAQLLQDDLYEIMLLAEESFRTTSPLQVKYRIQHASNSESLLVANFMSDMQEDDTLLWHGLITEMTKHQQMENVLEHLYQAVDSISDPVFVKDRAHRWVFLNDACCRLIGHAREVLIGKTDFDFFPEHEARAFWEKDEIVFNSGQENINEECLTDKEGNKQTILTKKARYIDSHWQYFLVGIISNITERKQMEALLASHERGFRSMIENASDNIVRYDRELRILYANPTMEKTYGKPASMLIGRRTDEIAPDNLGTAGYHQMMRQVIETGQAAEYLMIGERDGYSRALYDSIRITPEFAADGSIQGVIAIGRDLSSTRTLEMQVAERERELHALIDNTPDVIIRYDHDCRRIWISENYERVYGNPISVAFGKKPTESWGRPRMAPEEYERLLREVMVSGVQRDIELDWFTFYGEYICQSLRVVPEYDAKGAICSVLSFTRDISELKRTELRLEDASARLATVLQTIPDMVWMKDVNGVYLACNHAFERFFGAKEAEIVGKTDYDFVDAELAALFKQKDMEAIAANAACMNDEWVTIADDQRLALLETRKVPVHGADGGVIGVLGISRDVTERQEMAIALQRSEQEYRTLIEHSPEIIIRYDTEQRRVFVSPAHERITGIRAEDALANVLADTWMAENISSEDYQLLLQQVMDSGEAANVILEWELCDGAFVSMDMRIVPEYDVSGQIKGTLVFGHDISRLRHAEFELIRREQEFRVLVEHSPDTINRYDRDCRRVYANPRMQIESGVPLEELLNKTPEEFPGGEQARAYQQKICKVLNSGVGGQFELTWPTPSGKEMCSHIHLTPEFDATGNVISVLAVGRDITEIDAYRKQIHNLAFFDTLTHLPNRALLSDRILQTVADAIRHGYQFGLMVMDLDRFKEINDTLGHSVGDQVLRETAERLERCLRNSDTVARLGSVDTVARLGGDEFAALLPRVRTSTDLASVASKMLAAFNAPFMIDGRELFISASIGIALYPDDSVDVETLFRYADSAMYHAKQQGRNNFQFYSANLTEKAAQRMSMENDLRKAQERNELELYYQPQVELESGKIIGAEALIRWNHGKKGLIAPDKFIPIAEETGLIVGIGEWVLRTACQAAVAWNAGQETPLCIAVNLSTRQFVRNDLVATVQRILAETKCQPSWIKLEITESLLLEDSTEIAAMLDTFNSMGHAISIDDFGTGYSALSYLNRFPVSQIKIDRSFVQDIPNNHEKTELVKVMISIAQVLKMELVAEGVETQEQADCLLTNGCAIAQGYLFGRPMPYAAFEALMASSGS